MMLAAESTSQADVERLVKKHRNRLAFLLEGFVNLRSIVDIEPWKRKRRIRYSILLSCILIFIVLYFIPTIEKNYATVLSFLQQSVMWLVITLVLLLASLPLVLSLSHRSTQKSKTITDRALELRTMLGDKQVVPLSTNQPAIISQDKLPVVPTRISLKSWRADALFMLMGATIPMFTILGTILPQLTFQEGTGSSHQASIFSVVYLMIVLLGCVGLYLGAALFIWQARRSAGVVVDSYELRGYRPDLIRKSQINIIWDDVQGFYVFIYKGLDRIYFLDSHEATFVWSTNHNSSIDVLDASDRLASIIVTYTHLPLRDLSSAVVTLLTNVHKN